MRVTVFSCHNEVLIRTYPSAKSVAAGLLNNELLSDHHFQLVDTSLGVYTPQVMQMLYNIQLAADPERVTIHLSPVKKLNKFKAILAKGETRSATATATAATATAATATSPVAAVPIEAAYHDNMMLVAEWLINVHCNGYTGFTPGIRTVILEGQKPFNMNKAEDRQAAITVLAYKGTDSIRLNLQVIFHLVRQTKFHYRCQLTNLAGNCQLAISYHLDNEADKQLCYYTVKLTKTAAGVICSDYKSYDTTRLVPLPPLALATAAAAEPVKPAIVVPRVAVAVNSSPLPISTAMSK